MAKKTTPPFRIAPLQRLVGETVTDPAELAAMDEWRRRQRAAASAVRPGENGRMKAGPSRVLKLCRRLPAEERLALVTRLAARLPAEAQLDCLAPLLAGLPTDLLRQLEEELRPHQAKQAQ